MKTFLFTVLALSLLLDPGSSIAEPTDPNEVGLYMTTDGYGATGTYDVGVPVDVFLVLTKPADVENNNAPYATINYFECQLNFNSIGYVFKIGDVLPPGGLNLGDTQHAADGYLEYIVVMPDDIPVTEESVVLIKFTFVNVIEGVTEVTLGPISISSPAIQGQMCFMSVNPQLEVMYSVGGSHDAPVFIFCGEAVPVENETFGSVKALYR